MGFEISYTISASVGSLALYKVPHLSQPFLFCDVIADKAHISVTLWRKLLLQVRDTSHQSLLFTPMRDYLPLWSDNISFLIYKRLGEGSHARLVLKLYKSTPSYFYVYHTYLSHLYHLPPPSLFNYKDGFPSGSDCFWSHTPKARSETI